ncbi:MAG: hypothetical protein WD607_10405 [Candidatus Paceibacterota bacterium]
MNDLFKKFEKMRSSCLHKHLDPDFKLTPEEKIEANYRYLCTNQPLKKRRRYYIDPFDYGIPTWNLKHQAESHLTLKEITQLFDEVDIDLPARLNRKVKSLYKAALIDSPSPIELYISERNAHLIFGVPLRRLHLFRKTGSIKVAKYKSSYCYPWTQLQELFG